MRLFAISNIIKRNGDIELKDGTQVDYITAQEASEKWGITRRRVQILCSEGRVNGAIKIANLWVIPKNAEKPDDARKK